MPVASILSCRSCAAPLSDGIDAPCPSCGAVTPPDPEVRRRLVALEGRVRRVRDRVRAHAVQALTSVRVARVQPIMGCGLIVALLLMVSVPVAGGLALDAVAAQGPAAWIGGCCAFSSVPALGVGFAGLLWLIGWWARRGAVARAEGLARDLQLTVAVRCDGCGARVDQVVVGTTEPHPCPWCGGALAPPPEVHSEIAAAAAALEDAHAGRTAEAWDALLGAEVRQRSRRPQAGGLTWVGGVWQGEPEGIRAWCEEATVHGGLLRRLELDVALPVDGPVWRLPGGAGPSARLLRAIEGCGLPRSAGGDVPDLPELEGLVGDLQPGEAVLIEPSGLSVWRLSSSTVAHLSWLPKPWLRERVPQALSVVRALRGRHALPPAGRNGL